MSVLGAVRRANAKQVPEDSVALRGAVLVAVLAAVAALLAQGVGGPLLRAGALVGIPAGFVYSHRNRHRDGYLLKALLAAGVLAAFASFLSGMGGIQPGAINELQLPLAELFLWVQILHSLDVPARRDLLFSLLSSLILVAVAGVLSVSSGLAVYLVVWAAAALAATVLAHRSEVRALPGLRALDRGPRRQGARVGAGSTRPVLTVFLLAVVVAAGVFLVVPAAGSGKAVAFPARLPSTLGVPNPGGLANPSLGGDDPASPDGRTSSTGTGTAAGAYHGFATRLDTGVRGRPGETLIMRVKADRPDFWRGQSFDRWDGRSWTQSDQRTEPVIGESPISLGGGESGLPGGPDFVQTVYLAVPGPNLLFAAYAPAQVYFSDRLLYEMSDGTVRTAVQMLEGSVYTVVSRRQPVTGELLRASDSWGFPVDAGLLRRYTSLPEVPDRVSDLAREVTAGAPTTYDKVRALERWMGANTEYTLDIPPLPPGADAVEQYLFEDRKGFCEQIGSALVVMLRSLGIPARLAVGYTPGERNPFTGMWEVRAKDAHAWAEVWFGGFGWQAFDPTA
ncbi:MAG TPA: transglutaminase domain-containing protein, partial [Acidimicrobiales bacterium]|nr:transglutaminase domain-containing protein [Acidimicrobiales bacterium]